jgi:hypothetical protein
MSNTTYRLQCFVELPPSTISIDDATTSCEKKNLIKEEMSAEQLRYRCNENGLLLLAYDRDIRRSINVDIDVAVTLSLFCSPPHVLHGGEQDNAWAWRISARCQRPTITMLQTVKKKKLLQFLKVWPEPPSPMTFSTFSPGLSVESRVFRGSGFSFLLLSTAGPFGNAPSMFSPGLRPGMKRPRSCTRP